MINKMIPKFQSFRNRLFKLFHYRAGATMDLIDTVSAETNVDSIVKLSLSDLFRRKYSSITDVLSSLFRLDLKKKPKKEDTRKQTLKVTQLLAEECCPLPQEQDFALFAIDCTANSRIYADKVYDRKVVHAPNHVPGQKPITVGHEYSVLVHLPDKSIEKKLHWVIPLSTRRVESHESGPRVGLSQLEEISNETVFKDRFCVNVADAAYSTRAWVVGVSKWSHVVHIARMRGNRKIYRMPPTGAKKKRGRPLIYGEDLLLKDPSQPDLEEITAIKNRKGCIHQIHLARWNDVIMKGSKEERTHEHPFDLVRITVTNKKNKPVYRRPLWVMVAGARRRNVTSKEAYSSYGRRYDIEHFFRFGKQRLGLVNSQTCETRHEESWHWIGLLAYNMLYHARQLTQPVMYPWEKRKVYGRATTKRPSQVQRDYGRIIRRIGTPAPVPKPRGKSSGRQLGFKSGERPSQPLIRKSRNEEEVELSDQNSSVKKRRASRRNSPVKTEKIQYLYERPRHRIQYARMRRVWSKNRPEPMRC